MKLGEVDDVFVTLSHPQADGEEPPTKWIEAGSGPRLLARPIAVQSRRFGCALPLSVMTFRYRNSWTSRLLVRVGLVLDPWTR